MGSQDKYVKWVRTQPCCGCGVYGVEAHHVRVGSGMGKRPLDLHTIPVCRACHMKCHASEYTIEDQLRWMYQTQNRATAESLIKW